MDERPGDPGSGPVPHRESDNESGSAFPSRYEVHVHGRVSDQTLADYPLLSAGMEQVETVLVGVVRDQSELSGLVLRLQDDGLEVTEFRRLPD
jgi:methyl coenzyme M reductase subunit D